MKTARSLQRFLEFLPFPLFHRQHLNQQLFLGKLVGEQVKNPPTWASL